MAESTKSSAFAKARVRLHGYWPIVLFGVFGALTAAVYLLVLSVALELLRVDYKAAVSAAYFIATGFHFVANKFVTFKDQSLSRIHGQLLRYLTVVAINYLITLVVTVCIVEVFQQSPYVALPFAVGATFLSGYVLLRAWVFNAGGTSS